MSKRSRSDAIDWMSLLKYCLGGLVLVAGINAAVFALGGQGLPWLVVAPLGVVVGVLAALNLT